MQPLRIKSIGEYHKLIGRPKPEHPLISVVNLNGVSNLLGEKPKAVIFDFYSIALKRHCTNKIKYGQQSYDFDEGVLGFVAPNQVIGTSEHINTIKSEERSGWLLFIHPDFLWNTSLAKTIKQYEFFEYSTNEALHLSAKEETMIINILKFIEQEYHSNIDKFSKSVIIAQVELLLSYADRFYHRQFLTREKSNHQISERLEKILTTYFNADDLVSKGLPTVQYIADSLNVSPKYLSSLLKVVTGQGTQQYIHERLIEKAKEKLSTTNLSVSEIAYELGFEHPQSFSKLFKAKTNVSPLKFRESFN